MAEPAGHHDRRWLTEAAELAARCPPTTSAFNVGAVLVGADGTRLATGYSRESDPHDHAEEAALGKLDPGDPRLAGATMYTSLEPCSTRASRPRSCTDLILAAGIPRVVFAWREPAVFVDGTGAETLAANGVEVVELPELAHLVRAANETVLGRA